MQNSSQLKFNPTDLTAVNSATPYIDIFGAKLLGLSSRIISLLNTFLHLSVEYVNDFFNNFFLSDCSHENNVKIAVNFNIPFLEIFPNGSKQNAYVISIEI